MSLHCNRKRQDLTRFVPPGGVGAEIGVNTGRFAHALAKGARPRRLYLVDAWWTLPTEPSATTRDAHRRTCERMKWWIDRDIVHVIVKRSVAALSEFEDHHLDWAYLDASHNYAETLAELELLAAKVKPDGLIGGHDFNTRRHPGVFRALTEFLNEHREYVLVYQDNFQQWGIRRRETRESAVGTRATSDGQTREVTS